MTLYTIRGDTRMQIDSLLSENILYYPSIEFPNVSWVKCALCIWEKIYRIVPLGVEPDDDPEIATIVQEGIVQNLVLEKKDISQASEEFIYFLDSLVNLPAGLKSSNDSVINLHKKKVDSTLYPILEELALRIDGDWIKLSPEIANGYMLFLANSVSKRRQLPKITDNKDVFSIMSFFEQEGNFDEFIYSIDRNVYYTTVIFPTFLPGGVTRVDIDNLLRFREDTKYLRASFRQTIEQFVVRLKDIDSFDYALDLAASLRDELESFKLNFKELAKQRAIKLVPSLLAVGLPTFISTLGLLKDNGNTFEHRNLLGAVSIGIISSIAGSSSTINTWTPQCASYYLKMNSRFSDGEPLSLEIPKFDKPFEEFINC